MEEGIKMLRNKKFGWKHLIASNLVTFVLMSVLTVSLVVGAATINVYLDDLPSQATYTIKTDGTNIWSVRFDGYKASESTDARTVINAAITSASAVNGSVYFTKGLYTISGGYLSGASYVTLDGTWGAHIKSASGSGVPLLQFSSCSYFTVKNLQFDGNRATQSYDLSGMLTDPYTVQLDRCDHFVIDHNYVHDSRIYGIHVFQNWGAGGDSYCGYITNNYVVDIDWNGISLGTMGVINPNSTGIIISNNIIRNVCDVGLCDAGCNNLWSNNQVIFDSTLIAGRGDANTYCGAAIEGGCWNSTFIGNKIIFKSDCPVFTGTFGDVAKGFLLTASGCLFEDNDVWFHRSFADGSDGFQVDDTYNTIRGGKVYGATYNCAYLSATGDYTLFDSIKIEHCGGGINNGGSATGVVCWDLYFDDVTANFVGTVQYHDTYDQDTGAWIADV
jgi:hypothetical protein